MPTNSINQTVLVTGASSGIGQGIAVAFGQSGANVIVNYHSDEDGAKDTLDMILKGGGQGLIYKANVGNEAEVKEMFKKAIAEYKGV